MSPYHLAMLESVLRWYCEKISELEKENARLALALLLKMDGACLPQA